MAPEPTVPDGLSAPSEADWDRHLADGFAVLLGRPLGEYDPDAVYAARVGGNLLYETGFRRDPAWVRPAALTGAEPVVWDCSLFDEADHTPVFDASRSLFEFPVPQGPSAPLGTEFAAALDAVRFARGPVRGADLAPLLTRYGIDLTDPGFDGTWSVHLACLVSDGTLFDALRSALATGRTPEQLVPFTAEPEEEWEERLATITHPGLRTHLGFFCTDGGAGLMPLQAPVTAAGPEEHGFEPVAGWEDDFGQLDITVVRLAPQDGPSPAPSAPVTR
ncbi:hypothetical protein [Streptomyces sp. NPDC003522]